MKSDRIRTFISAEYVLHDELGQFCMERGLTEEDMTFEYDNDMNVLKIKVEETRNKIS